MLVTLVPDFPIHLQPDATRGHTFWSSSDPRERTFHARPTDLDHHTDLLVAENDPRGFGMLRSGKEGFRVWTVSNEYLQPTVEGLAGGIPAQSEASLAEKLARTEQALKIATRMHVEDIERIGTELLDQAARRDWCSDFDEAVDEVNRHLHVQLPTREQEWTVEVEVTYHTTVTVTARTEEEAKEQAENMGRETFSFGHYDTPANVEARDTRVLTHEF